MAQIRVMQSAAFKEAYLELVPEFEAATGHKIESLWVSGVPAHTNEPGPAKALIAHFKGTAAHPVIRKWGMEPA